MAASITLISLTIRSAVLATISFNSASSSSDELDDAEDDEGDDDEEDDDDEDDDEETDEEVDEAACSSKSFGLSRFVLRGFVALRLGALEACVAALTGDFGLSRFSSMTGSSSESSEPETVLGSESSFRRDVEGFVTCFLTRFGGSFVFED